MSDDDFAFEPIEGLPEVPPEGETILWRGHPEWWPLAKRAFYVRPVAAYFAFLVAWRMIEALSSGGSLVAAVAYASELLPFILSSFALLIGLGWAYARSTVYTLTSKRLVVRSGVALPITVNVPYSAVHSADLTVRGDGTGDIVFTLLPDQNASFLALWPHIKPWHFGRTRPMLRCLADPKEVGETLADAITGGVGEEAVTPPQAIAARQTTSPADRRHGDATAPRGEPALNASLHGAVS